MGLSCNWILCNNSITRQARYKNGTKRRPSQVITGYFPLFVSQQAHRCVENMKKHTNHPWLHWVSKNWRRSSIGSNRCKTKSPQRAKTRNYWNKQPVLSGFPQSKSTISARLNHHLTSKTWCIQIFTLDKWLAYIYIALQTWYVYIPMGLSENRVPHMKCQHYVLH